MGWGVVEAVKPVFCSGTSDNRRALAGAVLMEKSLMVSFLRGRFSLEAGLFLKALKSWDCILALIAEESAVENLLLLATSCGVGKNPLLDSSISVDIFVVSSTN